MTHTLGPWKDVVDVARDSQGRWGGGKMKTLCADCLTNADGFVVCCTLHAGAAGLLEAAQGVLAKECLITTSAGYLEYRALEAAIAKAEGRE